MSRMAGALIALLLPALLVSTLDSPTTVVLATVAVAVAALLLIQSYGATSAARRPAPRSSTDDRVPLMAGRVTDPLRHPLRPRAPGLV
ncbi:hypothetical protein [Nocardioides sp. WS12]|uniref:hypothetical protein n=1 Tax=Nocardioides sp. WS12 TaxID=2486272 RepID=UPI0015FB7EC7|nr:hypothetical protein [Nocardioides sp. WS12]